jgi:hypothetical protein
MSSTVKVGPTNSVAPVVTRQLRTGRQSDGLSQELFYQSFWSFFACSVGVPAAKRLVSTIRTSEVIEAHPVAECGRCLKRFLCAGNPRNK